MPKQDIKDFFISAIRNDFYKKQDLSSREGPVIRREVDMNIFPRERRKPDRLDKDKDEEAILSSHSHEPGR